MIVAGITVLVVEFGILPPIRLWAARTLGEGGSGVSHSIAEAVMVGS